MRVYVALLMLMMPSLMLDLLPARERDREMILLLLMMMPAVVRLDRPAFDFEPFIFLYGVCPVYL
jgi:uncharacterized membrane protein YhaH (DUF805 family)